MTEQPQLDATALHAAANTLLQAEAGKMPLEAVPLGEIARLLRSLADQPPTTEGSEG